MRVHRWMVAAGLLLGAQALSAGTLLFTTDFETSSAGFTGGTRVSTEGYAGFAPGFSNWFYRNTASGNPAAASALTVSGLPSHTSLSLYFLLAIIDSWDGTDNVDGPDSFQVKVDGTTVFSGTYTNFAGAEAYQGTRLFFSQAAGFNPAYGDSAYSLGINGIAHTGPTATIEFFGAGPNYSGGVDESFAIDNVALYAVPEPGSLLLLCSGAAALLLRRRT